MMIKKEDIFNVKLDPEEQDLLDSVERGEWKTIDNAIEEAVFAKQAAANFLGRNEIGTR